MINILHPLRRTLCAALCLLATCATALASNEGSPKMPVLKITVDGKITADMNYTQGTMQLTDTEGNVVEMKAKFRTRGATARKYLMKPSLNMKLRTEDYASSQDSMLLGMRSASKWILDAMAIDRICMRNRVAMDVWNEYAHLPYDTDFGGRSGSEGKFVEMYINNEYKGIYSLSDHINRKLLNLKKYDEKKQAVRGVLYKSGTEDIADQNNRNFTADWKTATISYHNAWELKEPEDFECEEAWQPLIDLYDNQKSYDAVKKYFFLDNLVDYQLHIMAFSIQDNWGNKNHYFSIRNIQKDINDPEPTEAERRKCVISPWDLDTSLGGAYNGKYYAGNYSDWKIADIIKNGGCYPFSICQGNAEYKALLKKRWAELRTTAFSKERINARLDAYCNLFVGSGAWQRMTDHYASLSSKPLLVDNLTEEVSLIKAWYAKRFAEMDEYFGTSTGVSTVLAAPAETDDAIYSLEGIRLNEVPAKGLYIQGGKVKVNR